MVPSCNLGVFRRLLALFVVSMAISFVSSAADAADWCAGGKYLDVMMASYHVNPDKHFNQFNPGLGVECWLGANWAVTAGGFRNSLDRPSFYGGAVWAPEFLHWGMVRVAAIGGIISGYNYGSWGLGRNHTIGPIVAPVVMAQYKSVGLNLIIIPPIPSDDLPFTLGFQARVAF